MFRQKKGQALMAALVALLIISLIALVLFPFVKDLGFFIKRGGSSSACTISLIGEGVAKCPIDVVEISSDKVQLNGEEFIEKNTLTTNGMANKALADLLRMCSSRGGGPKSRAFQGENWAYDEAVCLQCATITLKSDVEEIRGLLSYLRNTKPKGLLSDETYLELLTSGPEHLESYMELGKQKEFAPSKSTFTFTNNKEYTLFFVGLKEGYFVEKYHLYSDLVHLDFLKNHDTYYTFITEAGTTGKICDRSVNN